MSNRIKKQSTGFTQINNKILIAPDLSLKAKGLYAYMFSKPEYWNFTLKSMSKQLKEGIDSLSSAISELKEYGLVEYEKHQDGTGTYFLYAEPKKENQNQENPNQENPNLGKPKRISNTDLDNNKDSNKKNIKKDFTFKLKRSTQYENLSEEYKQNLIIYAAERTGNRSNELLSAMIDHHSANGKGFVDWSAAFRTWERNDKKFGSTQKKDKPHPTLHLGDKDYGENGRVVKL